MLDWPDNPSFAIGSLKKDETAFLSVDFRLQKKKKQPWFNKFIGDYPFFDILKRTTFNVKFLLRAFKASKRKSRVFVSN